MGHMIMWKNYNIDIIFQFACSIWMYNHYARELRVNHKISWSFNLRLNLKIANFWVRLRTLINDLIIND